MAGLYLNYRGDQLKVNPASDSEYPLPRPPLEERDVILDLGAARDCRETKYIPHFGSQLQNVRLQISILPAPTGSTECIAFISRPRVDPLSDAVVCSITDRQDS
jgi:hypothetical protein